MLPIQILYYFIASCFIKFVVAEDPIVQLSSGKIRGRVAQTFHNTTFYAFQEIPYAAPPVGSLRFKASEPVDPWDGILETVENTKICYQYSSTNSLQNEDCLYLNVYTPVDPNSSEESLPVLVYIHGGGFVSGDAIYNTMGPDFFMDTKRIVVVTINYRLGIFGFLSTEDDIIPGNYGLRDQTFALKWVQDNIHLFGGDPSKVTIDGQSAGSASVSYHILSKQSQGLFRAAISESGTVLTTWAYQRYARDMAYQTAKAVDSAFTEDNSSEELLTLLQNVSAKDLQTVASKVSVPSNHINTGYPFAPVVDNGDDAFLPVFAYETVNMGEINKVAVLMGMNSEETIGEAGDLASLKTKMTNYDNDLSLIVNDDFHIENTTLQTMIGETLRSLYTDGLFQDDLGASIRFLSDCRYTTSIIKFAQLASKLTYIYFYHFSYDGDMGNMNVHIDGAESVGHSEELQYLWRNSRNDDVSVFPEADVLTHKRLIALWTNFVTDLVLTFGVSEDPIIQLPNGKIKGRIATTFQNNTFYAFQEIPYAAPPVGSLRFKAPTPVQNWEGTLDATKNTKICYQQSSSNNMQNEDCLYLNVYTPQVSDSNNALPVLVFIHGGKFLSGDGIYTAYGPDFFMDTKKLVVVTLNYRLGPFGFLSTEDDVIPGNNGLKDQLFAFKWVQENIHLFGGDPSKVTVDGQSAGSASVSYHVLSEKSQGLFRAAILESGTVLTPWSYQRFARNIAYQTAAALDSSFTEDKSSEELLVLLQSASAEEIRNIAANNISVPSKHINTGFVFAPVLETGDEAFVTERSYEALEKGEINLVPLIVGMNSEEAIGQAKSLGSLKKMMLNYDNDLSVIVNDDFHIENETLQAIVGEEIRNIYTSGLFQDDLASSVRFISDSRYSINVIKYAELVSKLTEVYFYQFSYDGELGNEDAHIDGAESVGHSEELQYLWRNSRNNDVNAFPEADVLTHQRLIALWTNFVTELNPTPGNSELLNNVAWPLFSPDEQEYLDVREELQVKTNPKGDVFPSWKNAYENYGNRPFDTY
ncbi:hypothetical protein NQ318_023054 [Aromia moschata]|uniref:Carboxylesterase type B domain-containing protein n=1 Tax=Aromia moschata TaxID=1265417 RepID=A0AAV8Y070_9CUCU|nr:hypothetical protein NQ318_023054 [Aromia moschata]